MFLRPEMASPCSGPQVGVEKHAGARFLKLTTSFIVNISLKFKTSILEIHCHFLFEKCKNHSHIFQQKINMDDKQTTQHVGVYVTQPLVVSVLSGFPFTLY